MDTVIVKVQDDNIDAAASLAGSILAGSGIAAFPTDTVYGLGAVYSDQNAVRKIFEAKGRPETKPLSVLVADAEQVRLLADEIPPAAEKLIEKFWPGALTLIFKKKEGAFIPDEVTAGGSTIGVRMPDSRVALRVIACAGSPLAAPSANISGRRSASKAGEVIEDLNGRIDLIVDGGDCPVGVSSTVIDCSTPHMKLLREGTVTRAMIEEATGDTVL